jgi:transcription antitermination factor NusG
MTENWNALYLKPRTEKKVAERLSQKGYEVYLPLCIVKKQYSDRWKKVEEPLLKSYIFVAAEVSKNPDILRTDGVLNYVHSSTTGKLAVIKKAELDQIQDYLSQKVFEESEWNNLKLGDTLHLTNYVFQGKQATVVELNKNSIKLVIEDLGFVWEVKR